MTPSKILFYFCISFIVGIFLGSVTKIPQIFLWIFLLFGLVIIISSLFFKKDFLIIIGFCSLFLLLGIIRLQISEFNIESNELRKLNDKSEIILTGIIIREPDVRDNFQKLKIEIESPEGIVLVTTNRYPEYKYLDKIKIVGELETPSETEDFNYKKYLLKDGIYSVMNFPKLDLLKTDNPPASFSYIYSGILQFKQKLRESIRKNYSPPQSLILEGTVLGDNGVMSQDLKDKLNITGLRHIISVSGTHVVILAAVLMSFLLAMGFWRGQAFYIAIIFICLYIILTGLPASGVRAGIMGGLYLLAQKLGRQSMGSRVIASACVVMLLINPLLLFYDIGFQLSFLAVMGLIYLEPFIKDFFKIFIKGKSENLVGIVSTTFAAQIFTLPIMVYNFGSMSLVSPITNLLILPIVSSLMILGFLSSVLGIMSQFLGWIISIPCWFLLTYFVKIIDMFSQPWAIKTIENVHWLWLVIFYLVLAVITRWLKKNKKLKILE
jgi:competence protein ComEC